MRRLAHAIGLCLLLLVAAPPAPAPAVPVQPQSAAGFRDSVGVNVHIVYFDTAYGDWPRIVAKLDELGVDHLRDGIFGSSAANYNTGWNERYWRAVELAAAHGKRFTFIMGYPGSPTGTIDELAGLAAGRLRPAVEALEAPNEWDLFARSPGWAATLRPYIDQMHARIRSDPRLAQVPIVGPSLVYGNSRGSFGSVADKVDFGNMHPYTGGLTPNIPHLLREMEANRQVTGARPFVATEAGFHTAVNATNGQPPVSERVQAAYTLRQLLVGYRVGVKRTFLYELIDEKPDPGRRDAEQHFGLLRNDYTAKPAFTALKNMLALVGRPDQPQDASPVDIDFGGATQIDRVLLRSGDGRYQLWMWRWPSMWDTAARREIPLSPESVSLGLPAGASDVSVARPLESQQRDPRALTGGRVDVDVPGDPVMVEFRVGEGPAPRPTVEPGQQRAPGVVAAAPAPKPAPTAEPRDAPAPAGSDAADPVTRAARWMRVRVCVKRAAHISATVGYRASGRGSFRRVAETAVERRSRCLVAVKVPASAYAARTGTPQRLRVRVLLRTGRTGRGRIVERLAPGVTAG